MSPSISTSQVDTTPETRKFFVYGTLKVGGALASRPVEELRLDVEPAVLEGYDLYNLGWFPGIIPGDGKVYGELHEYADPETIYAVLDQIEGYRPNSPAHSLFVRKEVVAYVDGHEVECEVYVYNQNLYANHTKIEDGIWPI